LGPNGKGLYATFSRISNLFSYGSSFAYGEGVIYLVGESRLSYKDSFGLSLLYAFIFSLFGSILFYFSFRALLIPFPNLEEYILYENLFYIVIPALIFYYCSHKIFQAHSLFSQYNLITSTFWILQLLFLCFAIYLYEGELGYVLSMYTLCIVINSVVALLIVIKYLGIPKLPNIKEIYDGLIYSIKVHALDFPVILENQIDVFVLFLISGSENVGIYTVGVSLAQLFFYATNSISTVLFPSMAAKDNKRNSNNLNTLIYIFRLSFLLILIYGFLIIFLGESLIPLIFGEPFINAYSITLILLPGVLSEICFRYLVIWFKSYGEVDYLAPIGIISLSINISLIPLFYKYLGLNGVALVSTLTYTIRLLALIVLFNRTSSGQSLIKLLMKR
jgi:O-antigen/teichoic acid export membrane protein